MKKRPLVSIIIPTHNRRDELKECLKGIFCQDYPNKEVLIVDNNSTDNTKDVVRRYFLEVKIIENPHNLGAAQARNQGIARCSGEYVWFLDSDSVILNERCLSTMVDLWNRVCNIGAMGGEIVLDSGRNIDSMRVYDFHTDAMSFTKTYPVRGKNLAIEAGFLPTFNFFTSREIIYQVGGFDPHYFYLAEDKEVSFKIKKLGYKLLADSRISVLHNRQKFYSERLRNNKYFFDIHKNRVRFAIINFKMKEIFHLPYRDFSQIRHLIIQRKVDLLLIILAYLRNVFFLPREIYIKLKKPNFLMKIK